MNHLITSDSNWKRLLIDALLTRLQVIAWSLRAYRKRFHCWPNLFAPKTFNEKVQLRKILDTDKRLPLLGDKVLVKDYVRARLGENWVIPTLWSGTKLPPIAARTWPKPFVVKVNSGCGWNIFVRSDAECDWQEIEARCDEWMSSTYGLQLGEWFYAKIAPQILIEPFIAFDLHMPTDYKFWVFNGKVEYIQVVTEREEGRKITFYDPAWKRLPYDKGYPVETRDLTVPSSLPQMIAGAEQLAEGFDFIRVDLYEIGGHPLFGELTFYPDAGLAEINPGEFARHLRDLWR
jgi:hypothetical protein